MQDVAYGNRNRQPSTLTEMSFAIRIMSPCDKGSVMDILLDTPEFEPMEVPVAEEVMDAYLDNPGIDYKALVAEENGVIVGYICFGAVPLTIASWDVYWLVSKRGWRGRGVGHSLLTEAERQIKETGGYLVLIETSSKPAYLPTRRFYRNNGYRRASLIRDFYALGDHRITFAKRL